MSSTRRLVMAIAVVVFALFMLSWLAETKLSPRAAVAIGKVMSYFVPISGVLALTFTAFCFPTITRPYAMTASATAMFGGLVYGASAVLTGAPIPAASYVFLLGFAYVGVLAALASALVGTAVWFVKRNH